LKYGIRFKILRGYLFMALIVIVLAIVGVYVLNDQVSTYRNMALVDAPFLQNLEKLKTAQAKQFAEASRFVAFQDLQEKTESAFYDTEVEIEKIIDKHFVTEYENCDYNILHFVNGDIIKHRFYEECL